MSRYVSAVPAYGRDYRKSGEVKVAWANGSDFLIQDLFIGDRLVNKDDKPADMVLNVRFDRRRKVCVIQ